ncbi:sensor histidine kinase [Cohnella candidum]|uniref:Sensor histidine kinase n=1 Tax=Cohnella candidum TaxID=2674991 RepID=A0A3G3JYW6_9BACL|nr:sensor histidine kinase [Cohnella candidum]AYQ73047.1 sensor histidine kinase [Cohnella candidum]
MPGWKNSLFRTKLLILFILLSSIPALLIGGIAYQKSSGTYHKQTEQDLSVILDQLSTSIERQIGDFDRFTILPYYLPDIFQFLNKPAVSEDQWGTAEIQAQRTMARLMSAYPSINSSIGGLMIYGMNGTVNGYRIAAPPTLNPQSNAKSSDWYRHVVERKGGFVITGIQDIDAFKGASFRSIIGSRMLMDEDYHPLGVIAIFISPEFIPKLVQSLELPTAQVVVKDKEGNLIYASHHFIAENLKSIATNDNKGAWETKVNEGGENVTYSGVFQESSYLGWDIYLGINRDEMLKASRSIRDYTIVIAAALMIVAALLSWLLARNLSQPISKLIRSMREVELGHFNFPRTVREDEIGLLEKSYGRMVGRLQELIQSIADKERQKRHAELYALRARIQPHFLYNTLNSIRMLAILQQSNQIAKLIQSLNKLLRANMKLDAELVSLEDEIRLLRDYTLLMDLRYTNVFDVEWDIPATLLNASVPPMLLQPLLENAIFHGGKGLARKLKIVVTARRELANDSLSIDIVDDGAGFNGNALDLKVRPEEDSNSFHIGLRNVQERIQLRFGEEYGLSVKRRNDRTHARVTMPYRILETEGDANVESVGG